MAGSIISTTITNSVTLGSGHYGSPLTITNTGEISVIGVGVVIPASKTSGLVVNDGSIISEAIGVSQSAGSFYNAGFVNGSIDGFLLIGGILNNAGSIESSATGLDATGGSLNNTGSIEGTTFGLYASGGSITNLAAGIISGETYGVGLAGDAEFTNDGAITGENFGLVLSGTASAVNYGTISANSTTGGRPIRGVEMLGGSLSNHGNIYGRSTGVYLSGGDFDNSGTVTGARVQAVEVKAGTFANTGSLISKTGHAALQMEGGVATNSGRISGHTGVQIVNGTFTNSGDIVGNTVYGVSMGGVPGGYLDNSGTISGQRSGLFTDGGNAVNSKSGIISGGTFGVIADSGSLTNFGTIQGSVTGLEANFYALVINHGTISGSAYGVQAFRTTSLFNYGNISGGIGAFLEGSLTNAGEIVGQTYGVEVTKGTSKKSVGKLHNSGSISGATGVELLAGRVGNYGAISGTDYGVTMRAGSLDNSGDIYGGKFGVEVFGGSLTNSGTIAGGIDAVYGVFLTLTVDPGAVFGGDVENVAGTSLLELAGTSEGSLSGIGSKIFGFTDISFASGSEWRIAGNEAGLAAGQQINGFARGDKIVLDGFAAKSDSYVTGVGLVLANASGKETLDITGSFNTGDFQVIKLGDNTTIALAPAHHLDQTVMLDANGGQAAPEMGFLRPAAGGCAAFADYTSNGIAALFGEIRGAKDAALDCSPRIERVISRPPVEVATLAAHGLGPSVLGLTGLSEQHNVNSASILPFGFERLA